MKPTLESSLAEFSANIAKLRALIAAEPKLFEKLAALPGVELRVDSRAVCVDGALTGDRALLAQVWKILRAAGYRPTERVPRTVALTNFSTYWQRGDEPRLWLYFSSTVCRLVQVGTETVEKPIYRVTCE